MFDNHISQLFQEGQAPLQKRLWQRLSLAEFFALTFSIGMIGFFTWYHSLSNDIHPLDYGRYLRVANEDFTIHYYAYWSNFFFVSLNQLPGFMGFILWNMVSVVAIFFAARLFRGRATTALLTYQMFYSLFYGQIMALLVGGLALAYWGIMRQKWHWAGLGLVIATTKFQTGLTFGLFLWLLSPISWRDRLKIMIVPVIITMLTLIIYPGWPLTTLETIRAAPPDDIGSISLWRWLGPGALIFWLPPILLPLSLPKRLMALSTTSALALPYFQQTDLLFLFVLPIFQAPLQLILANSGFILFWWKQWPGLWLLASIPLIIYISIVGPEMGHFLKRSLKRFDR